MGRRVGGAETCEGLEGPVGGRTFLGATVSAAQERAMRGTDDALEVPGDAVFSAAAVRALYAARDVSGRGVRGVPSFAMAGPICALTGEPPGLHLRGEGPSEALALDPLERRLPGFDLPGGPVSVADAYVLPVAHWTQLLWANLLALGPRLWEDLVGGGATGAATLAWAALRAGTTRPYDVAARLNRVGPGAQVHRNATVEGCWLGAGARVGAGAVLRGSILGDGAVVEELALVEGSVLGPGARVQRLAMAKFSVLEEACSFAGIMQLGVVGRGAVVKHGAILMDMTLGAEPMVRVGAALRPAPHGICGVCVGNGAVVGQGVRIAPGRAVPPGLELLPDPAGIVRRLEVPEGCTRARVRDGALEPA